MKSKKRVLLIGWDGADWQHIHPLLDQGLMPTLGQLIDGGVIGNLATLQPVLSPMLWNSVATGKFADKHGIHGFVEPDSVNGGAAPFSSVSRQTKALWNIVSQNAIRSNVINWWASHPAEKINGTVVSNLINGVQYSDKDGFIISPGTVHPAAKEKLYGQFKTFPDELTQEHILPFIPRAAEIDQQQDKRLEMFANTFAEMSTTHAVATAVMEHEPWDFMAVYYTGIDHFSHGFMAYHPPKMPRVSDRDFERYQHVIAGAYRFHDMMLARLLELAGEDTTVILCSDHGFQSGQYRPQGTPREPAGPAVWHRQFGVLVMNGQGIKQDERIYGASLIDIGPTILHMFGLAIGEDMDGRPLLEAFEQPEPIRTIPSWDDVDGDHGMHTDTVAEARSEELLSQFIALGYVDDQGTNKQKQATSAETENKHNLAQCLMWQERHEEAIPILYDIVFQRSWENRFILRLADSYLRAGYLRQSELIIEEAFELDTTQSLPVILIYASAKTQHREFDIAMQMLQRVIQQAPRFPEAYVQAAELLAKQRQWQLAKSTYQKAIEMNPQLASGYLGLSTCCLRLGMNQEAADNALKAVGLVHRLPIAHLNLGIALARSSDYRRALQALQIAVQFAPHSVRAHHMLAFVYRQLGEAMLADQHFSQCVALRAHSTPRQEQNRSRSEQTFELPEFLTESERCKQILRERPRDSDPVATSGKTFVLVAGLPRSGTSLMMQMLVAGGLEAITDGVRQADKNNPRGYLEWEAIKQVAEKPELLDEFESHRVLKVVSMLLPNIPRQHAYKVVFMMRPIAEVARSQTKMIDQRKTSGANLSQEAIQKKLLEHRNSILRFIEDAPNIDHMTVRYPQLIDDPQHVISEIREFVGQSLLADKQQMLGVIDPALYRNRSDQTNDVQ